MEIYTKTIIEVEIPKEEALFINSCLGISRKKTYEEKWRNYNINVHIVGFVTQSGDRVFQPECYSTHNLPTNTVKYFILQVSSLEAGANEQILKKFALDFFSKQKSA